MVQECVVLLVFLLGGVLSENPIFKGITPKTLEDGRLPDALFPIHYDLDVRPDIYTGEPPFFLSGSVDIIIGVRENTNQIVLNYDLLTVIEGSLILVSQDPDQSPPSIQFWGVIPERQFLVINLDGDLVEGVTYQLSVSFASTLNTAEGRHGIYWDSYIENGVERFLVGSQLQTIHARKVFPCFDEPAFKSTFNVSIARRFTHTAIGNGERLDTEFIGDGWFLDRFDTTPKMSCYLLAFAVVDFGFIETETSTGTISRLWVRDEALQAAQFGSDILTPITENLEEYTNYNNIVPIVNHVLLPNHGGAMENWGLIIYGESTVLWEESWYDATFRRGTASIIGHELAHFWWGNLVTCEWWSDTWLNEGFASFFESKSLDPLGWQPDEMIYERRVRAALVADIVGTVQPVRPNVTTPFEASPVAFTSSAYSKGASMLRMIETVLGPDTFQRAIQRYLQIYEFETAVTDDLWQVLTEQAELEDISNPDGSPMDVKEKFDSWVLQSGSPLVRATRNYETGALSLTQTLFNPNNEEFPSSNFDYRWNVPVNIYPDEQYNGDPYRVDLWIDRVSAVVEPDVFEENATAWYLVNPGTRYFYRVQYDIQNYNNIGRQLLENYTKFDVETRASLLDDTFTFAKYEILRDITAMELTLYLDTETEGIPWLVFDTYLDTLDTRLQRIPEVYTEFSLYIEALIRPNYVNKGWNFDWEEPIYQNKLQQLAVRLACQYGNAGCQFVNSVLFDQWQASEEDPEPPVPVGLRPSFYCTALRNGDAADWSFIYNQYMSEGTPQLPFDSVEKQNLLEALPCSQNTNILQIYLLNLINDPDYIRPGDLSTAVLSLAGSPVGRDIVWNYLNNNWRDDPFPAEVNLGDVLNTVVRGFVSEQDQFAFLEFVARYPAENPEEEALLDAAAEIIRINANWAENNLAELFDFFQLATETLNSIDY